MEPLMNRKTITVLSLSAALSIAGVVLADDMKGMKMDQPSSPASQPSTQPSAVIDLRNTVCPVSGDKVADSNLAEVYEGKVYHLCCPDCHKDFEKDPAKYVKAVAVDPAKYGVKK
jgi:YHS domain-containing protein